MKKQKGSKQENPTIWKERKIRWFEAPAEMTLTAFLEGEVGIEKAKNGNIVKQASGWVAEKEELFQKALEAASERLIKQHEQTVKKLYGTSLAIIERSMKALARKSDPHPDHAKKMWEVGRTEAGLPTRISENIGYGDDKIDPTDILKKLGDESYSDRKDHKAGENPKRKKGARNSRKNKRAPAFD